MLNRVDDLIRRQQGVGLVELMVGMTVSLIVALAAGAMFVTNVRGGADALRSAKLNVELRAVMDLMEGEIRRAGYAGELPNNVPAQNPFTQATTDLVVPSTSCVLLAYDVNADGDVDSSGPLEFFGFRRSGDVVQMRKSAGASPANNAGCGSDSGEWEGVTDNGNVPITAFDVAIAYTCTNAFTLTNANQACVAGQAFFDAAAVGTDLVESRRVTVTVAGRHAKDTNVRGSLTRVIRVRNDKVVTK